MAGSVTSLLVAGLSMTVLAVPPPTLEVAGIYDDEHNRKGAGK